MDHTAKAPYAATDSMSMDLFAEAPCGLVVLDEHGSILASNRKFDEMTGCAGETLAPPNLLDRLTRVSQFVYGAHVLPPMLLHNVVHEVELDVVDANGNATPVLLSGKRVEADGQQHFYLSLTPAKGRREFAREHLRANTLLERNQKFLDLAEKLAHVGHWRVDLITETLFWSPEVFAIHGVEPGSLTPGLGDAISFYHPDDRADVKEAIGRARDHGTPFNFRKRLVHPDGETIRVVDTSGLCETDSRGRTVGIFGVFRDVTDLVNSQRVLEESASRYRLITERANDIIAVYDFYGIFQFISPSVVTILGYTAEDLVGKPVRSFIFPADYDLVAERMRSFILGKEWSGSLRFRYRAVRKDGRVTWLEANPVAVLSADGTTIVEFQDVVRDITEQVNFETQLTLSEARYRLLADSVPGLIGYWDKDLRCRFANKGYLEWFGQTPEQLIGTDMRNLLGEKLFALNLPFINGVLAGNRQAFERTLVKPSGESAFTWTQYLPDRGASGDVDGFYVLVTDVTALRQKDLALQESNALKSAVLASTQYLVVTTDVDGTITVFNAAAETALGYSAADVIGRATPALWHDYEETAARTIELNSELGLDIEPGFETFVAKARLHGADEHEWTFRRKDGSTFPASLNVTPLYDRSRSIYGYLGVIDDITERKKTEMALRRSEEVFRSALQYASIGMAIFDSHGNWLQVNKSLCTMLGYDRDELTTFAIEALNHPDDVVAWQLHTVGLLGGKTASYQIETRFRHKGGWYVWVLASVSAVGDAGHTPVFMIAQIQDITARREMERVKSEFVSVVSHELRTPLTSIHGALGLVTGTMADKIPPAATRLLTIAQKNSERLTVLINDMLDIDKIATGNMRFDFESAELDQLLRDAVDSNQSYAEQYGVTIAPVGVVPPVRLRVDPSRMQQVLGNLLSNACKFSPAGGTVELSCKSRSGGVRIFVTDRGPGIDTAFRARIFERCSQADASSTRGKSGTGLGLYISRKLVEAMSGQIGFDSKPGHGSTFWVDLPSDPDH